MDYDTGRANFQKILEDKATNISDKNEANTRFQVIDRIFFECLDWLNHDVTMEESYGGEYADYTFSTSRRILIVEAKKEGISFELPVGKNKLIYSLKNLTRDYPDLKKALEQVSTYCQQRGIPYATVCNGHQIVVFVAVRSDGTPPLEGKAFVFPSLQFMLDHFLDLWQVLSRTGVERKNIQIKLIGDILPELPSKLSSKMIDYPGVKTRNVIQADLQDVSEFIIEDIAQNPELENEFLNECYSQSGALSQYSLVSKNILLTRYNALFDSNTGSPTLVPATTNKGITPELLSESLSRRPILLIGDVGVGKTTFIRHLIKIDAPTVFQNAITIYIDLGNQGTLALDLKQFITEEVARQLRENYGIDIAERNLIRGVYHGELRRFSKGIYSDLQEIDPSAFKREEINYLAGLLQNKEQHLKQVLDHVSRGQKKQIIMFIDNSDQRNYETQQEAFLNSQEIATNWPVMVFVALRPETFYNSKRSGALTGYHPKAFTISPPKIDKVVEKRLEFGKKLSTGKISTTAFGNSISLNLDKLRIIMDVFIDSLNFDSELAECLTNISGGNVRLALELVKGFFGSGHIDTQKIIEIYQYQGSYYVPLHEFLRAVIYGDSEFYDPNRSPIANVFDIQHPDPKEHFLIPALINLLASSTSSNNNDGLIETSKIVEQLQSYGFTPEQIDSCISNSLKKKLIESRVNNIDENGKIMPQFLRATTIGLYHVQKLCKMFNYIDAVIVDTPILDSNYNFNPINNASIYHRMSQVEMFCNYLNMQWRNTGGLMKVIFNWEEVSRTIIGEISRIRYKLDLKNSSRII